MKKSLRPCYRLLSKVSKSECKVFFRLIRQDCLADDEYNSALFIWSELVSENSNLPQSLLQIEDNFPFSKPMSATVPVWFRRDLRLFDHAALSKTLRKSQRVIAVFIFDSTILQTLPRQDRRLAYIWHSLQQ